MSQQRIKELREKQAHCVAEARARLDEVANVTDEVRAKELEEQHEKAMEEHDRLEKLIEREQKMLELENRATQRDEEQRSRMRPLRDTPLLSGVDKPESGAAEYRSAFAKIVCGVDPSELSKEERDALKAGMAGKEERSQLASVGVKGGYTVPTELANEIIKVMKAWGPLYDENICTVLPTQTGATMLVPTVDDTGSEAGAHAEADDFADDGSGDISFGQKRLDAYSYNTPFIKWSFELDMDSIFDMETLLASLIGERLGRIANRKLTSGTGNDQPNGIVTASQLGKTTALNNAFTWDDVMDLEHSVDPAYRASPRCRYMFNDKILQAARKLKDGQGNYLWQMGDVQKGTPSSFNGRPYSINQHMDELSANKRIMLFGDFSKYFVRKVGSPVIGVLRERFWPQVGIAGLIRFDGELGDDNAIKHLKTAA